MNRNYGDFLAKLVLAVALGGMPCLSSLSADVDGRQTIMVSALQQQIADLEKKNAELSERLRELEEQKVQLQASNEELRAKRER